MAETRGSFDGFVSGAIYDLVASLTGYGPGYYLRAAAAMPVRPGMTLLDLGCGTGSLSIALAGRMGGRAGAAGPPGDRFESGPDGHPLEGAAGALLAAGEGEGRAASASDGRVVGLDISARQLARARRKVAAYREPGVSIMLQRGSILALPFGDASVDGVTVSQMLHALPDADLSRAFAEVSRVLRPGGFLALVEWSRPRLGYSALVWLPTLLGLRGSRNWRGAFPEIAEAHGLALMADRYLDSLNRYQWFTRAR